MRLLLAIQCFFLVLFAKRLPDGARQLLPAPEPAPKDDSPAALATTQPLAGAPVIVRRDDSSRGAVQLLGLLQREGRLLDFLQEEIDGYGDAQIGAAVRDIHRGCKKALAEHLPLEPVLHDAENSRVRVDEGFDPSRIRLTGNVMGEPPYTGTLKHHGWRAAKVQLPQVTGTVDATVIAPAEVEI